MMIMSSSYSVHKGKAGRPSGTKSRDIGIRAGLVVLAPGEHHHVRLGGPSDGKNNDVWKWDKTEPCLRSYFLSVAFIAKRW